jgi:superfamily I DNA/RNA helicase
MNEIKNMIAGLEFTETRFTRQSKSGKTIEARIARPTPEFWAAYRSNPKALFSARVQVGKSPSGEWEVWRDARPAVLGSKIDAPLERDELLLVRQAAALLPAPPAPSAEPAPMELTYSKEQEAIFGWFGAGKGNLVVQARAGTGKTFTIKSAFERAPEQEILYAVFNKRNQLEALEKITDPRVEVKTLHSLGFSYIRSIWRDARPDNGVEYDRIAAAYKDIPDEVARQVERLIGFAKNSLIVATQKDLEAIADDRDIYASGFEAEEFGGWTAAKLAQVALKAMEAAKVRDGQNRISFGDMVWLPVAMNWVRPMFNLVVVDEAQDQSLPQLVMVQRACRKGGRVCVVGDSRQAIYGFRGAKQGAMSWMKGELQAAELGLTTTYRCARTIVAQAAQLVPDYKAAPQAPEGLVQSIGEQAMFEQVKVGDAILSRINAPLMSACLQLLKKGTPARIEGRDVGKQLVGMVRTLRARSVPDFLRKVERWEIKTVNRAMAARRDSQSKIEAARDQAATMMAVADGAASVQEIESRLLNLFQDSDKNSRPAVVLSSVHKAKGLEWDRVFLLEGTFKVKTGTAVSEEANIRYVAITRAKRELYLVGGSGAVQGGTIGVGSGRAGLDRAIQAIGEKHEASGAM